MAIKSGKKEKDLESWKRTASYLAMALAVTILACGIAGGWMSSENRALETFKQVNEKLRISNSEVVKKLTASTNELHEIKAKNKELMEAIFDLKVENAALKTLLDN